MTQIQSKRRRSLAFETLEGRLALSAGMGSLPASFKGHTQLVGTTLTTNNLTGTIGRDHFTGTGTGTQVGTQFEGGKVYLSNSQGTVQFSLGPSVVVRVKKPMRQNVSLVAVAATGKYASYFGLTGTLTTWNVPAKPNGSASFGGTLNG